MTGYLTPKEAAEALGISPATITRCVQKGAPVHRWGSCGRTYRIQLTEFIEWMDQQGRDDQSAQPRKASVEELRARRHKMMAV